ncbi:MAG: hypothetical protein ACYTX0_61220, partial [Nostoc sp.]
MSSSPQSLEQGEQGNRGTGEQGNMEPECQTDANQGGTQPRAMLRAGRTDRPCIHSSIHYMQGFENIHPRIHP